MKLNTELLKNNFWMIYLFIFVNKFSLESFS